MMMYSKQSLHPQKAIYEIIQRVNCFSEILIEGAHRKLGKPKTIEVCLILLQFNLLRIFIFLTKIVVCRSLTRSSSDLNNIS